MKYTRLWCKHQDHKTSISDNVEVQSSKPTGKIFQCQHCDHTTTQAGHLKAHYRKHTGEMLQCEHCHYTTAIRACILVKGFNVNIVNIQ